MYAIIETQGRQHKVTEGQLLVVNRMNAEEGAAINLDKVLLLESGDSVKVGSPYVDGANVTASVVEHKKGKKVIVFKKKRRKQYKRTKGHRQHLTVLKIDSIKG
jgi:large subunit ribosomal protein L21